MNSLRWSNSVHEVAVPLTDTVSGGTFMKSPPIAIVLLALVCLSAKAQTTQPAPAPAVTPLSSPFAPSLTAAPEPRATAPASTHTTHTAPTAADAWGRTVNRFAESLTGANDQTLDLMLGADCQVRSFDSGANSATELRGRAAEATLLGAHAYTFPPQTVAADVAQDFTASTTAPEEVKKQKVPADEDSMRRANVTAIQWITQALGATTGQAVGVIVLWPTETTGGT